MDFSETLIRELIANIFKTEYVKMMIIHAAQSIPERAYGKILCIYVEGLHMLILFTG